MFKPNQIAKTNKIYIRKYAKLIVKEEDCPLRIMGVGGCAPNQMTQGTRRPNQMEFKGRPNIMVKYKKKLKLTLDFRLKSKINVQIT